MRVNYQEGIKQLIFVGIAIVRLLVARKVLGLKGRCQRFDAVFFGLRVERNVSRNFHGCITGRAYWSQQRNYVLVFAVCCMKIKSIALRPMLMEARCCQGMFPSY